MLCHIFRYNHRGGEKKQQASHHMYVFAICLPRQQMQGIAERVVTLSKTVRGWLEEMTGTNSLQQQATTKSSSWSAAVCGNLRVIYSQKLEATGHMCAEWITLVLRDSELNGYLCRSAVWSLLMTSRWSSSIFKSLLSTREAVVMRSLSLALMKYHLAESREAYCSSSSSGIEVRNSAGHLTPLHAVICCKYLWEISTIQKVWKIAHTLITRHSPRVELSSLYNWISRELGKEEKKKTIQGFFFWRDFPIVCEWLRVQVIALNAGALADVWTGSTWVGLLEKNSN